MAQKITFDFNTAEFCTAHGKEPRGRGSWAFAFEGREPVFSPSMTYAEAKRWIKEHICSVAPAEFYGCVLIDVLS